MEKSTETLSLLLNEKCADPVHEKTKEKLKKSKTSYTVLSLGWGIVVGRERTNTASPPASLLSCRASVASPALKSEHK